MRKEIKGRYVIRVKYGDARASQITSSATDDLDKIKKDLPEDKPNGGYGYSCVTYHIFDKEEQKII